MIAHLRPNVFARAMCRAALPRWLACAGMLALLVLLPPRAPAQGKAPALVGTWRATDAVDDNERAWVMTIRRRGNAYEFVDPSEHPTLVLRGRSVGRRATFVQKGSRGVTTYTFTVSTDGRSLTGDRGSGGTHLGYHLVRVSSRAARPGSRHRRL
jgi:hypothetical protein